MKVAFAFFFLFIEGVEDQVRLLIAEQDYCTNSRLNIEDKKKKNTHLNDKWITQRHFMLRDLRHRVMNIELRLRNLMESTLIRSSMMLRALQNVIFTFMLSSSCMNTLVSIWRSLRPICYISFSLSSFTDYPDIPIPLPTLLHFLLIILPHATLPAFIFISSFKCFF